MEYFDDLQYIITSTTIFNQQFELIMKKILSLISAGFFLFSCLSAQKYESITVKAGTKVKDYFPYQERYLYPQFITGKVFLKNGSSNTAMLNYDLLLGEISFLKGLDTLVINRKNDIERVTIEQDTFICRNLYYKMIHGGRVKVCTNDKIELIEIVKQGAMGTSNRTSAGESFGNISMDGNFVNLESTDDMVMKRTVEFYILTSENELVSFRKKNVIELYLNKKTEIEKYLKSNKVNFESQKDILRFADWLEKFTNKI
jgi:hypothetical protein